VAGSLDPGTERIVTYLADAYAVPINVVFFHHFVDGGNSYLTRTWLIDPSEAETKGGGRKTTKGETWNGRDFYVAFGEEEFRSWEDARRYGFVSAGQGSRYSNALRTLAPGHRIWACIPKTGYVGVGIVTGTATMGKEFGVGMNGSTVPILDASLNAPAAGAHADDPEMAEYYVPVEWIETVPRSEAFWRKGMFANQNIVCKLKNRFTLNQLMERFGVEE
jgi:hypothetical protein